MEKIFSEVFAAAYAANIHKGMNSHGEHMEAIQRASQAAYLAVAKFRELEVSTAPKSVLNPYR
jgi:sugar/nucleoside kinase (ribokinase family)